MPRERLRRAPPPDPGSYTISELEGALRIDEHALEQACVYQAPLFYKVASELARLESERLAAKKSIVEVEAATGLRIRAETPPNERITIAEIDDRKALDDAVRRARDELMGIDNRIGRYDALKEAYRQRAAMLKELVALYLSSYYSDPVPGGERRFNDIATQEMREARRASRTRQGGADDGE